LPRGEWTRLADHDGQDKTTAPLLRELRRLVRDQPPGAALLLPHVHRHHVIVERLPVADSGHAQDRMADGGVAS